MRERGAQCRRHRFLSADDGFIIVAVLPRKREEESSLRVLIVDDDALIRDSLKMILKWKRISRLVGLAANGEEALELCRKSVPTWC